MTDMVFIFFVGLAFYLASLFVMFAPPASQVFKHPECSIAGFSPDLSLSQKQFCRGKK
jgi:hypothetical protein